MSKMTHTRLIDFRKDDFHSATAKTIEEAVKMIEADFEYICSFDNIRSSENTIAINSSEVPMI